MTPQEKLQAIKDQGQGKDTKSGYPELSFDNNLWLIARVEQLESALIKGSKNGVFWRENALNTDPKPGSQNE